MADREVGAVTASRVIRSPHLAAWARAEAQAAGVKPGEVGEVYETPAGQTRIRLPSGTKPARDYFSRLMRRAYNFYWVVTDYNNEWMRAKARPLTEVGIAREDW